jgi:hypothetical protein
MEKISSVSKSVDLIQEVSNETNTNEITGYNVLPKLLRLFGAVANSHTAPQLPFVAGCSGNVNRRAAKTHAT